MKQSTAQKADGLDGLCRNPGSTKYITRNGIDMQAKLDAYLSKRSPTLGEIRTWLDDQTCLGLLTPDQASAMLTAHMATVDRTTWIAPVDAEVLFTEWWNQEDWTVEQVNAWLGQMRRCCLADQPKLDELKDRALAAIGARDGG